MAAYRVSMKRRCSVGRTGTFTERVDPAGKYIYPWFIVLRI
jgi:hypothetical protein